MPTSSVNRCAIYSPAGIGSPKNPFGKDVANLGLYRALAQHGGLEELCFLLHHQANPTDLANGLGIGTGAATTVSATSVLNIGAAQRCGTVFRGKADLADLAWLRQRHGAERSYSLVGLVHSIAPPAIRQYIGQAATSPVQPWDALICTSPVVRDGLRAMFTEWGEFLAARFGAQPGARLPMPALPLLPLGVDVAALAQAADEPGRRERGRGRLNIGPDEILVLWVGRLSFFEKAFPQPMFQAVQDAAERSGKRLHFAMAGWFPNPEADRERYAQAARVHAPGVPVHFLDGTDKELVSDLWAGGDIFLSLVDNIQETFGITPLEAMGAGIPVVASDWDGYRATIRHGLDGFLVETLGGPPGLGELMLDRHLFGMDSYQSYVGQVAQHTAVHVGRAAEAIAALASDPELRRRTGAAGRERVRTTFDWPVVARQYRELFGELAAMRRSAAPFGPAGTAGRGGDPVRAEPFASFAPFATRVLDDTLRLYPGGDASPARLAEMSSVALNAFGSIWRANPAETQAILRLVGEHPGVSVAEIIAAFRKDRRKAIEGSLVWLGKLGLLLWDPAADLTPGLPEAF
jgi:glycosyltransferase involved in cell wall biosynthesis